MRKTQLSEVTERVLLEFRIDWSLCACYCTLFPTHVIIQCYVSVLLQTANLVGKNYPCGGCLNGGYD